jgi:hypothetical protein
VRYCGFAGYRVVTILWNLGWLVFTHGATEGNLLPWLHFVAPLLIGLGSVKDRLGYPSAQLDYRLETIQVISLALWKLLLNKRIYRF